MKRKLFFALWLLAPVAVLAYHFGPGQKGVAHDKMAALLKEAEAARKSEDWNAAEEAYAAALKEVPADEKDTRARLELAKAEARIFDGETPEAIQDLQQALRTAQQEKVSEDLQNAMQAQLSAAHYYAAWLVRLENVSEEEWKIQCEQARQGFRYLAEKLKGGGDTASATQHQKNLESAIRLAQMDLNDLRALPLPKQCGS
jgi:murein L,D-transpeptidase YcbB/YkuD